MSPAAPPSGPRSRTPMTDLVRGLRIEPPNSTGSPGASVSGSTVRVGALRVLSTAPCGLSTVNLTIVRLAGRSCAVRAPISPGQGVSAPAIGRQRRFGCRAAVASSRRRTGAVWGAARTMSGSRSASAAMAMQRVGERVERLERLGLGRLDEHALVDDEREVDGRRVEAVVDEALGDVEGAHAGPRLDRLRRRHELVLAGPGRRAGRTRRRAAPCR